MCATLLLFSEDAADKMQHLLADNGEIVSDDDPKATENNEIGVDDEDEEAGEMEAVHLITTKL